MPKNFKSLLLRSGFACLSLLFVAAPSLAEEVKVDIQSNYLGGNVVVVSNSGDRVELTPDLRGGKPWFYWNFEATRSQPGRVTFVFSGAPKVGVCGPAISLDEGNSWQWLGHDHVSYDEAVEIDGKKLKQDSFTYDFAAEQLTVRFAVAMPYLRRDLEAFLQQHDSNPHLTQNVLSRTRNGTPVTLLTVGEPRADVPTMLLTARHHACESMASYVVEGFVAEAISDSAAGVEFRKHYTLQVVPIVDTDGVEAGDQGKWRDPHDHNRDYGEKPLYPEIQAIQDLAAAQKLTHALDVHCPALRGDVHEAFYFDGLKLSHINMNVNELIGWIREERPPSAGAPLNFLKQPKEKLAASGLPFSHYFSSQGDVRFAATLEVPYTQRPNSFDAAMAHRYGAALLRAWNRTTFFGERDECVLGRPGSYGYLQDIRTTFQRSYRGQADKMLADAESILREESTPSDLRAESHLQLARLELLRKQFAAGLEHTLAVLNDPLATTQQKASANLLRISLACTNPDSKPEDVEAPLKEAIAFPDAANEYLADAYDQASRYYEGRGDYQPALEHTRRALPLMANYKQGNTLLRIAHHLEQLDRADEANTARKEAVETLRAALDPVPKSVFGALMTIDLFDALASLPTATLAEKQAAAKMVLEHAITSPAEKQRVKQAMAELEAAQQ